MFELLIEETYFLCVQTYPSSSTSRISMSLAYFFMSEGADKRLLTI